MKSIMKEMFNVKGSKRFKINIDPTMADKEILQRFTRYLVSNREESYKVGQIKNGLKYLGYTDIQLKTIKEMEEDFKNLARREGFEEDEYCFIARFQMGKEICVLVDKRNGFKKTDGKYMYRIRTNPKIKFAKYNVLPLVVMGEMFNVLREKDWEIIKMMVDGFGFKLDERTEEKYKELDDVGKLIQQNQYNAVARYINTTTLHEGVVGKLINKVLVERLMVIYNRELNFVMMDEYNKGIKKDYARAFQTKKNIPKKIMEEMKTTKLLNDFKYVELDEDVDINKFKKAEEEILRINKLLPKSKVDKELRFRKLGNYRAAGLYYPTFKCIVIDLREIWSYVHEYGHYLDYTYRGEPLSLDEDFLPIIMKYRENYYKLNKKYGLHGAEKSEYFNMPTEIFARGFEIYQFNKLNTYLIPKEEYFKKNIEYMAYLEDRDLMEMVEDYYLKMFGIV